MRFFGRQGQVLALLLVTAFAFSAAAGVKYVAVVETDVDAASGASESLNPAEVRQVTAELRRVAVENLPRDRYNVMTSETVQSMGGAVLEECAEENCVITLGNKIGADYIVRGVISKFQNMLTLSVEMYETENGTLVASSYPVRSERPVELLDKVSVASANLYKKFAGAQGSTPTLVATKTESKPVARESKRIKSKRIRKLDYYVAPNYQTLAGTPDSWLGYDLEIGMIWGMGWFFGIDFGVGDCGVNPIIGLGLNLGNAYDLGNQRELAYGGALGFWGVNDGINLNLYSMAPFVKLRWKYVELTYRVLLGTWIEMQGAEYESPETGEILYTDGGRSGFAHNHQIMLGLYFATSKRTRPNYNP